VFAKSKLDNYFPRAGLVYEVNTRKNKADFVLLPFIFKGFFIESHT